MAYNMLRCWIHLAVTVYIALSQNADGIQIQRSEIQNSMAGTMDPLLSFRKGEPNQTNQADPTHNMRKPVQLEVMHNVQNPVQIHQIGNMRQPLHKDPQYDLRQKVRVRTTHLTSRPIMFYPTRSMVQPVLLDPTHTMQLPMQGNQPQLHSSHNMRQPQLHTSHNMRQPVKVDPAHNMRQPVKVDPTHNMRQPVKVDPTHNMRQPVQTDQTHNMRRPVALHESQDLRWPVVEEKDHDSRNTVKEFDSFKNEFLDMSIKNVLDKGEQIKNGSENNNYSVIYQMKLEDEVLESQCNKNHKTLKEKTEAYDNLLNDAIKVCGKVDENIFNIEKPKTEWPWIVTIQQIMDDQYFHVCTGSLLNNQWVATAAHCVWLQSKFDFLLRLGGHVTETSNPGNHYIERSLNKIVIHPQFNMVTLENDVALLRMSSPVEFTPHVTPICLPEGTENLAGQAAQFLGRKLWNESGSYPEIQVQVLSTVIISNRRCERIQAEAGYVEKIASNFLCTGKSSELLDSCEVDSGSPLIVLSSEKKWTFAGLFSFGNVCGSSNNPGIYTRISKYLQWINKTIDCYENQLA